MKKVISNLFGDYLLKFRKKIEYEKDISETGNCFNALRVEQPLASSLSFDIYEDCMGGSDALGN